jgi:hypothetical protein
MSRGTTQFFYERTDQMSNFQTFAEAGKNLSEA